MSPASLTSLVLSAFLLTSCTAVVGGTTGPNNEESSDLGSADAGAQADSNPVPDAAPVPVQIICDDNLGGTAADLAKAMELCDGSLLSVDLQSARTLQYGVTSSYGQTYAPRAGSAMATIATGGVSPQEDKDEGGTYNVVALHPQPRGNPADGCGRADPLLVQDMVRVVLRLKAPDAATGFQFDFNFMSAEFPEYLCTEFDDTFLAVLDSEALKGNISFDENQNVISINTGFFDVCNPAHASTCQGAQELSGTGYDNRGGTGWLTTKAPIGGGEEFSLTFHLFDEGDALLTSQVLLDNFQWIVEEIDDPITID